MAIATPIVVVFEDLHWADLSSITLLESLLGLVEEVPALFIGVMRPDGAEKSDRILAVVRQQYLEKHTGLQLQPLDHRQCHGLVTNLLRLDDLPFSIRNMIARKTDGNPFFIEEVVRSLIDQEAIEERNGHCGSRSRSRACSFPGPSRNLLALGTKAKIQILSADRPAACATLLKAQELMRRSVPIPPYYQTFARTAQLMADISVLEETISQGDRASIPILLKRAKRADRVLLRLVSKVAWERVEALRLAGRLAWIAGKRDRALGWFSRAIAEGERLGARSELARTYLEVGLRLRSPGKAHGGLDSAGCLEKARSLFSALALSSEVDEAISLREHAA